MGSTVIHSKLMFKYKAGIGDGLVGRLKMIPLTTRLLVTIGGKISVFFTTLKQAMVS